VGLDDGNREGTVVAAAAGHLGQDLVGGLRAFERQGGVIAEAHRGEGVVEAVEAGGEPVGKGGAEADEGGFGGGQVDLEGARPRAVRHQRLEDGVGNEGQSHKGPGPAAPQGGERQGQSDHPEDQGIDPRREGPPSGRASPRRSMVTAPATRTSRPSKGRRMWVILFLLCPRQECGRLRARRVPRRGGADHAV
jgi:hypothetical protein